MASLTPHKSFEEHFQSGMELSEGGLRDQFLISMPSLRDPVFAHAITYICDHTEEGALGIVINHPLDINVGDIFEQLELDRSSPISQDMVMSGGPVQMDRGFVLHPSNFDYESTIRVSDDICLTASRDVLEAMANQVGPDKAVVALGYAGWGAGQLEEEILANSWLTVPADKNILFNTPCEHRWAAASKYLGIDLNLIHGTAGHA
ncbi:YqgE/AlgH family protein [Aurantivibrio plasticivorans]